MDPADLRFSQRGKQGFGACCAFPDEDFLFLAAIPVKFRFIIICF
jgi:hypothetical protein